MKVKEQDTIASKVGRPPKFKTPEELAEKAEGHGYKYAVCRSLDEFIDTVEAYLR